MLTYTSSGRPLVLQTPLGPDALLVAGVQGHEAISELFHFRLDLRVPKAARLPFDQLLGQKATLTYRLSDSERHFSGILRRIEQHDQDDHFTWCVADLVPTLWLLTQRRQSRIFQQMTVPNILRAVFGELAGLRLDLD